MLKAKDLSKNEHSQQEKVKIDDMSPKLVNQFLNFIYTRSMKDERHLRSDDPTWIEMLPQLVCMADKVNLSITYLSTF